MEERNTKIHLPIYEAISLARSVFKNGSLARKKK